MTRRRQKASSQSAKRLIGWLVSYGLDEMGFSYELRTGRTFVSAAEGSMTPVLTLNDESVSTPHLAIKATPKHRVLAQDVFSLHGSFITRSDGDEEQPITGPTEIRHGDWIRIGEKSRFQVCLIDGKAS